VGASYVVGRYYKAGWSIDPVLYNGVPTGNYEFSGTLEDDYPVHGGTLEDLTHGRPSTVIDSSGHEVEYVYDETAPGQPHIRTNYTDGTFEAYCYNSRRQVTRYRDREGNVTWTTYDAQGRRIQVEEGLRDSASNVDNPDPYGGSTYDRCATDDVQTNEYAVTQWEYHGSGQNGEGLVSKEIDPLGNETDYEYDAQHRLVKITEPADVAEGTRPETTFTYDSLGRLKTVTDPAGDVVEYFYDFRHRRISTLYDDGSTEKVVYGTTGTSAGLVEKTIDRRGVVTTYEYDDADRLVTKTVAAAQMDGSTETATPELAVAETLTTLTVPIASWSIVLEIVSLSLPMISVVGVSER
jgi:YD repeat-containing protein